MVMHSYVLIVNKLHTVNPKAARGFGSNIRKKKKKKKKKNNGAEKVSKNNANE